MPREVKQDTPCGRGHVFLVPETEIMGSWPAKDSEFKLGQPISCKCGATRARVVPAGSREERLIPYRDWRESRRASA